MPLRVQYDNIDQFKTPEDLQSWLTKLGSSLEKCDEDWTPRQSALEMIEKMATESMDPEKKPFRIMMMKMLMSKEIVVALAGNLNMQMSDERSEITKQCSRAVVALANAMGKRFKRIAARLFPELLKGCGRANKVIRGHVDEAAMAILKHVQTADFIYSIMTIYKGTKNLDIQKAAGRYFHFIMESPSWDIRSMIKRPPEKEELEGFLRGILHGKDPEIRELARHTYWHWTRHFPRRRQSFEMRLSTRLNKALKEAELTFPELKKGLDSPPKKKEKKKKLLKPKAKKKRASRSVSADPPRKSTASKKLSPSPSEQISESVSASSQVSQDEEAKWKKKAHKMLAAIKLKEKEVDEWKEREQSLKEELTEKQKEIDELKEQAEKSKDIDAAPAADPLKVSEDDPEQDIDDSNEKEKERERVSQEQITEKQNEIDALKQEMDESKYAAKLEISGYENEIKVHREMVEALKEEMLDQKENIEELKYEINEKQTEIDLWEEKEQELHDQLLEKESEHELEINEWKEKEQALQVQMKERLEEIEELKQEHANQVDALASELKKVKEQNQSRVSAGMGQTSRAGEPSNRVSVLKDLLRRIELVRQMQQAHHKRPSK